MTATHVPKLKNHSGSGQTAAPPSVCAAPLPCVTLLSHSRYPPARLFGGAEGCPSTVHPPMEATAAVARRAGLLARARAARPRGRARARAWERGVGLAPSAARRRLLAASLGVGEPLPPAQSLGEEAVALEVFSCRLAVVRLPVSRCTPCVPVAFAC
jgi:hypothetical protein